MAREIAVFIDQHGNSASVLSPGKVVVYRKQMQEWQPSRELEFALDQSRGIREMRLQMAALIDFLQGCKIFVALTVVGVAYFELEKAQIAIWEFEGRPAEFLDYIQAEEEAKPVEMPPAAVIPAVEERLPGCFHISIKEIQENEAGITSKQVLMPIISKKTFTSIEVICNHVPPWLEMELTARGLIADVEKLEVHTYRVSIQGPE